MNTFKWFMWLKKEELKEFCIEYWKLPAFIAVICILAYAVSFLPYIHSEKTFILRMILTVFNLALIVGILALIIFAITCFIGFIKDNWDTAIRIRKEIESWKGERKWCDACNQETILIPLTSGYVTWKCKCQWPHQTKWRSIK